jgi:hypothetical protein
VRYPQREETNQASAPVSRVSQPPIQVIRGKRAVVLLHLAQKIRTSKTAVEDERKQITVLFAILEGRRLPCCAALAMSQLGS